MLKQFSAILALTATNALLQVGHGAVAALAVREGGRMFSETSVGFMVSAVYAGFLGSNLLLYRLLPRVSYIRTYAVCAAVMASLTLLLPMLDSDCFDGHAGQRQKHGGARFVRAAGGGV